MSAPDTLTLASLRTTAFAPGQLGVLGDPIAHSLSPAMHNAALAALVPSHPRLAGVGEITAQHIAAADIADHTGLEVVDLGPEARDVQGRQPVEQLSLQAGLEVVDLLRLDDRDIELRLAIGLTGHAIQIHAAGLE